VHKLVLLRPELLGVELAQSANDGERGQLLVLIHGDRSYIRTAAEAARTLLSRREKPRDDVRVGSFASSSNHPPEELIRNLT
jgi:hypothetical protein